MSRRKDDRETLRAAAPKDTGPVDQLIGKRVMMRRRELGMSQAALADQVGISFQQLQKYERGENRITVARLASIASELETAIGYFLVGAVSLSSTAIRQNLHDETMQEFEVHDLLSAFLRIEEEDVRLMIVNLVRATADGTAAERPPG